MFFFFKQKTAYEMRISDWSSDVCSSDLIAVEKRAQIIHSVFEHRQPIDPAPDREALPFVGIEPARGDHLGMHHPRAEHFHPPVTAADDALALIDRESDNDFGRRLGKREIARAQPEHDVVALQERLEEGLERPFEIGRTAWRERRGETG